MNQELFNNEGPVLGTLTFFSGIEDRIIINKSKYKIMYVSWLTDRHDIEVGKQIEDIVGCEYIYISELSNLFALLSNVNDHTDMIVFDIQNIYESEIDVYSLINSIDTVVKCFKHKVPILAVSIFADTDVKLIKKLSSEIKGIIPTGQGFTLEEKVIAIRELLSGNCYLPKFILEKLQKQKENSKIGITLTPRQEQILNIILTRGASNKTIAKMLGISESTVKLHVSAIFKKFGVKNRTQLAVFTKNQNIH